MRRSHRPSSALGPALALTLLLAVPAAAADFATEPAGPPPGGLPETVARTLTEDGVQVNAGDQPHLAVWLRTDIPEEESSDALGVAFGGLPSGALLGVVRLEREWKDYKEQTVSAGTYTARYLVALADGAHTGVSIYRDFLLLVPAADDPGPETVLSYDELVAASREATGTNHPAVMALFPIYPGTDAQLPAILRNDLDQPTLAFDPAEVAGGGSGAALGLVVEGHGES